MTLVDIISNGGLLCDGDWIEKKDQDVRGKVRLIQLADIGDGEFKDTSSKYITLETAERLHCTFLEKGDILIARLPEPLGRACIFPLEGAYITAVDIAILRIKDISINPQYIMYLINSSTFRSQIKQYESGTTRKRISRKNLEKIEFSLPNLEIQNRIVARIEELFSELDKAVGTLKTTKEQLEVYRQAVLVDIFSQEHPLRQLKEISVALSGFAFKSKNYTPDGKYTVIKIGNVKDGYLDFSRDKTRTNEVTDRILQKYLLKQGDCLITLTGTRGKRDYGFVSMIERQTDYLLNQRVAALRFDTMIALPEFFRYYLSSLNYRNQFFKYETGNVGQGNVGIKALCEPAVPCPPLDTQKKIVDQISDRLSVCDSIEKTVDTALAQADAMRQSILKQAFEGTL